MLNAGDRAATRHGACTRRCMTREVRVVLDNRPYLIYTAADGTLDHAHGPFSPGTEPSLGDCTDENEVLDAEVLDALATLMPISPTLRHSQESLAEDE